MRGTVGGRTVALGNAAMMLEMGLDAGAAEAKADTLRADGKTAMFIAVDGALAGIVAVADPIKDSTAQAIRELHGQGLRVIMATGDNEHTAKAVAGKLGIDEVRAGVLPEGDIILPVVKYNIVLFRPTGIVVERVALEGTGGGRELHSNILWRIPELHRLDRRQGRAHSQPVCYSRTMPESPRCGM